MEKSLKCIFCGKPATPQKTMVRRSIKGKVITLANAPIFHCEKCNETFYPKETQAVFAHIKDSSMEQGGLMFNYDKIAKEIGIKE